MKKPLPSSKLHVATADVFAKPKEGGTPFSIAYAAVCGLFACCQPFKWQMADFSILRRGAYRAVSTTAECGISSSGACATACACQLEPWQRLWLASQQQTTELERMLLTARRSRQPATLPYDPLLILCAEGLRETVHPHNFVAPTAFVELCKCEGSAAKARCSTPEFCRSSSLATATLRELRLLWLSAFARAACAFRTFRSNSCF